MVSDTGAAAAAAAAAAAERMVDRLVAAKPDDDMAFARQSSRGRLTQEFLRRTAIWARTRTTRTSHCSPSWIGAAAS